MGDVAHDLLEGGDLSIRGLHVGLAAVGPGVRQVAADPANGFAMDTWNLGGRFGGSKGSGKRVLRGKL